MSTMTAELTCAYQPGMSEKECTPDEARNMIFEKNGLTSETIVKMSSDTIATVVHQCVLDTIPLDYQTYRFIITNLAIIIICPIVQWNKDNYKTCLTTLYYVMRDIPVLFEFDDLMQIIIDLRNIPFQSDHVIIAPIIAFIMTHENGHYSDVVTRLEFRGQTVNVEVATIINRVIKNREICKTLCDHGEMDLMYSYAFSGAI